MGGGGSEVHSVMMIKEISRVMAERSAVHNIMLEGDRIYLLKVHIRTGNKYMEI